ncbi:Hypothetical_protein [Hexamita inflata]|uniref:Hypothetical_protein n=1 Tax=Hexamita inflata TaxID=28002 RepID=A0AA86PVX5_9EUKA|nr:Hypothetical protein HINF_LOCUS34894 [Hexamita inflata]
MNVFQKQSDTCFVLMHYVYLLTCVHLLVFDSLTISHSSRSVTFSTQNVFMRAVLNRLLFLVPFNRSCFWERYVGSQLRFRCQIMFNQAQVILGQFIDCKMELVCSQVLFYKMIKFHFV